MQRMNTPTLQKSYYDLTYGFWLRLFAEHVSHNSTDERIVSNFKCPQTLPKTTSSLHEPKDKQYEE